MSEETTAPAEPTTPTETTQAEPQHGIEIPEAQERPEWLPEKFKTTEELLQSYQELERKQGATGTEPPAGQGNSLGLFSRIKQELEAGGELSAETQALAEREGLTRADLSAQVEALRFTRQSRTDQFIDRFGGKESVDGVIAWAATNAPSETIDQFNQLSKDLRMDEAAVLFAGFKHEMERGQSGQFINGKAPTSPGSGAKPFTSRDEMVQMVGDPRYKVDKDYRDEVQARMRAAGGIL